MLLEISITNGIEKSTFYHQTFFSKFHLRGIADDITLKEVWEEVEVKFRKKCFVIIFRLFDPICYADFEYDVRFD